MRKAVLPHPNVKGVVDLLTMRMAAKQILVNAPVDPDTELTAAAIVRINAEIEEKLNRAGPKVDMIFLEAASVRSRFQIQDPEHEILNLESGIKMCR